MAPKGPKSPAKEAKDAKEPETPEEQQEADIKRFTEILEQLSKKAPGKVAPYVKKAAPHAAKMIVYTLAAMPYVLKACVAIHDFIKSLPEKVIYAGIGFAVCFFGGIFPATIAAVEAWNLCGGREAVDCVKLLYKEAVKVQKAHEEDEKKDDDANGIPDAREGTAKQQISRKLSLAAKNVDPEHVSRSMVGIYTGWIGVIAILKIKFAKTVTLGERIGEQIYRVACKAEPAIQEALPEEHRKWVPLGLRWTCKMAAMIGAWWIQRVISAFHSAIRGGHLFGKYLVEYLNEKEIIKFNHEDTYMDEAVGWALAALGLLFQFSMGFHLTFPLNLLLWPMQLVEGFVIWSVAAA